MEDCNLDFASVKPWGNYQVIGEGNNFKIKIITVNPGQKLSLQYHLKRSENWIVLEGVADVTVGDKKQKLVSSQSVFIDKNEIHRLENDSKTGILKIAEIQTGDYLGDDDILRLEDKYLRK